MVNRRMLSQQLSNPLFNTPEGVVEWMGALQAQEIRMVKWAIGIRMQQPAVSKVKEALDSGTVIRAHILRTTWHVVPAKDFRWMAAINEEKLLTGFKSWARSSGIVPEDFMPVVGRVEKILEGRSLTKQEITEELGRLGVNAEERMVSLYLSTGEVEGRICSGPEKNGKNTYALTDDRIKQSVDLSREEALAELARRYFRSHGPATLEDFVWWSGLGVRDAKCAVASLGQEIITHNHGDRELMIHCTSPAINEVDGKKDDNVLRFLPPYDEYLISYKNRLDCIREKHTVHAYNNFGIFQPVILHKGHITGNWRRTGKKIPFDTTFFPGCRPAAKKLTDKAGKEFMDFLDS